MEFEPFGVSPWLAQLSDSVVEYWHANRTAIILAALTILIVLRLYFHFTEGTEPLHVFPKIYDAEDKPVKVEEKVEVVTRNKPDGPRRIKGELTKRRSTEAPTGRRQIKTLIFYSSLTGNTEKTAKEFVKTLAGLLKGVTTSATCDFSQPEALDLAELDLDEYFITPPKLEEQEDVTTDLFYLFLLPSYNIDSINDTFLEHLNETHNDFRIDTAPLAPILGYSVFGFGDKEGWPTEEAGYCFQAKELDRWLAKLTGRKRAYPLGTGDLKGDGIQRLSEWTNGLLDVLGQLARDGTLGDGVPGSGDAAESDDEADVDDDDGEVVFEDDSQPKSTKPKSSGTLEDLEDLGRILQNAKDDGAKPAAPLAIDFTTTTSKRKQPVQTVKEMVPKNSPTYNSLTKQGYSIVGSHSGVKICRWTKSALRGRGSCYKFSFYGINSHQCMETTPSLSCSNKCVFCWRHGTNPVGTNWRWVVDPPDLIFNGVKENHYKKIKMMRGVPGVRAERFAEAMRIRHCALSLVGEPIFYPHINEFLEMLHGDRISSFLVCNAQHPDQLAALNHVTQLYVSIDASNKESLRKIDRPLHRDFWERFQRCLEILREKRFKQRTVFRLTLVKGFNIEDEAKGYADLVEKSLPCFVEVKGVTYCGTSTSSSAGLSMANVPFYEEVCEFVTALERELKRRGLNYGIAAEHAHSCCILLGSERFKVDGKWRTQIDYDRFFDLLEERGPDGDFTPEDYMGAETPEWATWGNGGFDPRDQRVDRKGRPIER
ncbi:S-adenosyl-L-methionine-dependent tRNA 4-demethylwyosine synthase [Cytospora mali]|uniref:S-adenosyl-L-methionine-dependent tRNA 4-demethylwyosine synthase n=1 Tax=Cytospora mali TaxID=578113 RepID=A0A194VWR7_CYTMA|nr:S-adenosyl-L-methionine-dependent tRNA 4-demethylwyosine synthase [Valsa mali]